jgi:rfaE bifunctional protein nucleotidyltransferase chain/domain
MTNGASKILSRADLARRLAAERDEGRTVAMANGLFDILHVGHLRYLEGARREADVLVVAVNSDASARRLKGPSRPVTPERERAELIGGFACVDWVTVFDEDTVEPLLRELRPDIHCKGTDYTAETVPESAVARELGIRVAIVGDPKDHATREILERLRGTELQTGRSEPDRSS